MIVCAIDPGNIRSAIVYYDTEGRVLVPPFGIYENVNLLGLRGRHADHLAIEMVASYGMPVGRDVFDTCDWIGRFIQAWDGPYSKVLRKSRWGPGPEQYGEQGVYPGVCMALCHNNRAKDSNIRRALLDRFPATGGGKTPQTGIKGQPGPLYGVKEDVWSALAVAVTYAEATLGVK